MRNTFTRKELALALACALAFAVMSESTMAQVRADEHAVVMDSSGAPVTSGFGLCLRSATPAGECKDANTTANVACMQADRHVFIQVSGTRIAQ